MDPRPWLRVFRDNPAFARLYLAQIISFAGDWLATVALLGLALELTGSAAVGSLVLVIQNLPFFLVAPFAGAVADRFDRRTVMIVADLARAAVCLGFLFADDPATLWIAFVCAAALAVGAAFFDPAVGAALPNLVAPGDLGRALALGGAAWGTMLAIGAAGGGLIVAAFGRDLAFLVNAGSFLVSAVLLFGIRIPFPGRHGPASAAGRARAPGGLAGARSAIAETVRLARGSRTVSAYLTTKVTFGVGTGVLVFLALFGSERFGAGDAGIGILFAARGVGAVLGPIVAVRWAGTDDRRVLRAIAIALVVYPVSYALLPLAPVLALGALCVACAHLGGGAEWTLSSYGLQRAVPDEIRGRVLSVDFALATLAIALSELFAGWLSTVVEPVIALWIMTGLLGVAGIAWIAWTRPLRRAPALPSGPGGAGTTLPA
ncbi:MAG: MFS transporter [Chloroflexota bacterium]